MHKKGITEEVAKKRSRKAVKHQRGIVGADLAAIAAKRNQTSAIRQQQRQAAINKAKAEKKEKESKKPKVRCDCSRRIRIFSPSYRHRGLVVPLAVLRYRNSRRRAGVEVAERISPYLQSACGIRYGACACIMSLSPSQSHMHHASCRRSTVCLRHFL